MNFFPLLFGGLGLSILLMTTFTLESFNLTEAQLFFGVLLSVLVALAFVTLGMLVEIQQRLARVEKKPDAPAA